MAVGAQRRLPHFDTANHGDLCCNLHRWQYAALARLGTLTQFYFEHTHLFMGSDGPQPLVTELAVCIAHAVLGGTDLEDDIGAAFKVVRR